MTKDELIGWHHRVNGHEFEQAPRDGEGQGSLACCSPRGRNELDTTEQLNNDNSALPLASFEVWSEYILQPHSQDGDKFGLSVLVCRLNEMMKSLSTVTDID